MQKEHDIKTFVIDTNVLIHNPEGILSFRDNEIVIPVWVLEELDHLKTYPDQRGKAAREAIRFLDTIARQGNLHDGIKLENGSTLRVCLTLTKDIPEGLDLLKNDNKIILTAFALLKEGKTVFFVSKDINARVKAQALGLRAVDYEKQKIDINTLYPGVREFDAGKDLVAELADTGKTRIKEKLYPNEFVFFKEKLEGLSYLTRYDEETGALNLLEPKMNPVFGILPLNDRQRVAMELLLDDSVPLVTIIGKAGTGKTLMAIACGLKMTLDDKRYNKVLVSRPVISMGKDIGYMPGEKAAKMSNWMEPLFDNLEFILSGYKRPNIKTAESLLKEKVIEIEALSFIRGRSLPKQFIIIDEAQNLTPHEVKTIVSRAGEGSKVVLTGDPYQIDNMYLDANSNGLTYLVECFKGHHVYGHVTLQKTERSELSELAAELL